MFLRSIASQSTISDAENWLSVLNCKGLSEFLTTALVLIIESRTVISECSPFFECTQNYFCHYLYVSKHSRLTMAPLDVIAGTRYFFPPVSYFLTQTPLVNEVLSLNFITIENNNKMK